MNKYLDELNSAIYNSDEFFQIEDFLQLEACLLSWSNKIRYMCLYVDDVINTEPSLVGYEIASKAIVSMPQFIDLRNVPNELITVDFYKAFDQMWTSVHPDVEIKWIK